MFSRTRVSESRAPDERGDPELEGSSLARGDTEFLFSLVLEICFVVVAPRRDSCVRLDLSFFSPSSVPRPCWCYRLPRTQENFAGARRHEGSFRSVATNTAHVISSTLRLFCIADRYHESGTNTLLILAAYRGIFYWYALTVPPYSYSRSKRSEGQFAWTNLFWYTWAGVHPGSERFTD